MALPYHPNIGTIVICDFKGFVVPEMVKRRPCIIISPRFKQRNQLCTIVPLSTKRPEPIMNYHYKLYIEPPLPPPYNSKIHWVKTDMLATVSLQRLNLPFYKNKNGKRERDIRVIDKIDLKKIRECVLCAIGLNYLTNYL